MKMNFFKILHRRVILERAKESVLLYLASVMIFTVLYVFIYNLFYANIIVLWVGFILLLIDSIFHLIFDVSGLKKAVALANRVNPLFRNVILASYEVSTKKSKNEIEEALIGELENNDPGKIAVYDDSRRSLIYRITVLGIIIFLIFVLFMPVWFSNGFCITTKSVIVEIAQDTLKVSGYNLGKINGRFEIEKINGSKVIYNPLSKYDQKDKLYFHGPGVESNKIDMRFVEGFKIKSIFFKIKPAPYQKLKEYTNYGSVTDAQEYSSISVNAVSGKESLIFAESLFMEDKDETIVARYGSNSTTVTIRVVPDNSPICRIIADEHEILKEDEIILPFVGFDDYGIESAGVMIKTKDDSSVIAVASKSDSLFFIKINMSLFGNEDKEIRAFVKDNNPFRKQYGWSQVLKISADAGEENNYQLIDTSSALSDFEELSNKMTEDIEKTKRDMLNKSTEHTMESFKKNLEDIKNASSTLKKNIEEMASYKLPEEILAQMYEISKQIDKIDDEIIKKLQNELKTDNIKNLDKNIAMELVKKNSESIERELKKLSDMLKTLEKINDISKLTEELESAIEDEKNAVENHDKDKQKSITDKLESMEKSSKSNENTAEFSDDLNKIKQDSKRAEENSADALKVQNEMENLKDKMERKIQKLTGEKKYDKDELIAILYGLLRDDKANINTYKIVYSDIISYISEENSSESNPLELLLKSGIKICDNPLSDIESLKNQTFTIISFLLRSDDKNGSSGMSFDNMMDMMKSLSDEQRALSQALWEMFSSGNGDKQAAEQLGKMQNEIAEKMKRMSEGDNGDMGLSDIADSLKDIAEEIQKGNFSKEIMDKQNRVFNRMLHLTKSLYRQGMNEKRESKSGLDYSSPVDILLPDDLGYEKQKIKEMLFNRLKEYKNDKYTGDIKKYYLELLK